MPPAHLEGDCADGAGVQSLAPFAARTADSRYYRECESQRAFTRREQVHASRKHSRTRVATECTRWACERFALFTENSPKIILMRAQMQVNNFRPRRIILFPPLRVNPRPTRNQQRPIILFAPPMRKSKILVNFVPLHVLIATRSAMSNQHATLTRNRRANATPVVASATRRAIAQLELRSRRRRRVPPR